MTRQPTEMEIRVARVIFAEMFPERPEQFTNDTRLMNCYIKTARAAIRAMREPTPDMISQTRAALEGRIPQKPDDWYVKPYQAMIDTASPPEDK